MSYLINFGFCLFLLGIFLLIKRNGKKFRWLGVVLLLAGGLTIFYVMTADITENILGMRIIKDTNEEYIVDFKYFDTKAEAVKFYQEQQAGKFLLLHRFEGSTKEVYELFLVKPNPNTGKRIVFQAESQEKTAFEVFEDFLFRNKLVTVYNSEQAEKK